MLPREVDLVLLETVLSGCEVQNTLCGPMTGFCEFNITFERSQRDEQTNYLLNDLILEHQCLSNVCMYRPTHPNFRSTIISEQFNIRIFVNYLPENNDGVEYVWQDFLRLVKQRHIE